MDKKESLLRQRDEAKKEAAQYENQVKILLNKQRDAERHARNHRLTVHGAILEGVFPFTTSMDGEAIKAFLMSAGSRGNGGKGAENRPHKLKSVPYGALIHRSGAVRPAGGCCVLADAMGKYLPQTPCAPAKTEHPLCVCSVSAGLYPSPMTAEEGGKADSNFSLSHSNYQAEHRPFCCRCRRLPERRTADK